MTGTNMKKKITANTTDLKTLEDLAKISSKVKVTLNVSDFGNFLRLINGTK